MRISVIAISLLGLLLSGAGYAQTAAPVKTLKTIKPETVAKAAKPVCEGRWSVVCGKGTVANIDTNGSARLKGTTVKGAVNVNGHFNAFGTSMKSANIKGTSSFGESKIAQDLKVDGTTSLYKTTVGGDLTVNGGSTITYSKVSGQTELNGTFAADHSEFDGLIVVNTPTVTLVATKAKGIKVGKAFSYVPFYRPKVHIDNGSVVTGNISFEGGKNGIVYVDSTSRFTGKVFSGQVFIERKK